MEWCLVCTECTGIIHSVKRFSGFDGASILCPFCNKQVLPDFQKNAELLFSPHPSLGFRRPNPHGYLESYQRYHFSRSYNNGGLLSYVPSGLLLWHASVGRGQRVSMEFKGSLGVEYNLFSVDGHALFRIKCVAPSSNEVEKHINYLGEVNEPVDLEVSLLTKRLIVNNTTQKKIGISLLECGAWDRFLKVFEEYPLESKRRIMGSRILLNPSFIRMFGHQTPTDSFSFQVGRLSIVFTDLKGSTALYSRLGDFGAYNIVVKHFDLLHQVVT